MRIARARRNTWRAARQVAEQVAEGSWVEESRRGQGGKDRRRERQQEQQEQQHRVTIEIVLKPLHAKIGASLHNEHAVTVQEEPNLNLDFLQGDVSGCVQ